ncbi:hypothetical protein BDP27DRAFT_1401705 [Rhodocollybia butyracea]|uniref:Uncharacterized protein n=1 Tax=Rhodocollybia butyracea TaxID=206335 RepID=A0A9P5PZ83_9AGAR|nr:hypothetical protein BDP27DRAFT_1401705 [Rhodocollybia butyracea]
MRFAVSYAFVLLVASFSCIWATPITVNRDTLQRRSKPDSRLKELGLPEVNGPMTFSLEQTVTSDSISEFRFVSLPGVELTPWKVKKIKEAVRELIERGLHKIGFRKVHPTVEELEKQLPAGIFEKFPKESPSVQVEFQFRFRGVPYNGILMNLVGNNAGEDADRGILYKNGGQIYVGPKAPPAAYLQS